MTWTLKHIKDRCDEVGNCWLWRQSVNKSGYPILKIDRKPWRIARWVLTQTLGREIGAGMCASPSCGDRRCCSPTCLREATRSEVTHKGHKSGARAANHQSVIRYREAIIRRGGAILSMEKAREIRARDDLSAAAIAREYGVSASSIKLLRANKTWREPGASVFNWRPA